MPEDQKLRAEWAEKAGVVAAHRDLTKFDAPSEALGNAPKPGQPEAYASWRAAWRALDLPEVDRDELEMSDGQLHLRQRAYEREKTWAPKYVAEELAGTRQAAAQQRRTAAIRQAEALAAAEPLERDRLQREAAEASALADVLDGRAALLEAADEARAQWLAHTAGTRAASDRATMELQSRRANDGREDTLTTAADWLAEHYAAQAAEDAYRDVTGLHDFADFNPAHQHATTLPDTTPDVQAAWPSLPTFDDFDDADAVPLAQTEEVQRPGRFAWLTNLVTWSKSIWGRNAELDDVEDVNEDVAAKAAAPTPPATEPVADAEPTVPATVAAPAVQDDTDAAPSPSEELPGADAAETWPTAPAVDLDDDDEPAYGWLGTPVDDDDFADELKPTAASAPAAVEVFEIEPHPDAAEVAVPDLREVAATEPPVQEADAVRVPSADETAETISRAQRALAEIRAREAADAQRAADEARAEQMSRWAADDAAAAAAVDVDVLDRGGSW
ncbi:hypothetical protein ACFQV2_00100 [Actinokineospora soli]|uniref:Death domain-containing protein n=1 Tax=Actinokineospora soli TaxID=1048753 RepID=A0ABW2TEY3_9PSEU